MTAEWYRITISFFNPVQVRRELVKTLTHIIKNGYEEVPSKGQCVFYCTKEQLPAIRNILDQYDLYCRKHCDISPYENQDWETNWKKYITPAQAGEFYIHPPWHPDRNDLLNITIYPGMAFGTGTHPSTQCILKTLSHLNFSQNDSVLDVGTGSGILAFASSMKKSPITWAVDIDPIIYDNFYENLKLNNLEGKNINLYIGSLEKLHLPFRFSHILINMLPQNFLPIQQDVFRLCSPGGTVLYSGFLTRDLDEIQDSFQDSGYSSSHADTIQGWSSLLINVL